MPSSLPTPRDIDLRIASDIAKRVDHLAGDHFILTGSYSIDALTGADIKHNDIDANIFSRNIRSSLGKVGLVLQYDDDRLRLTKQTDSRLEYSYAHHYGLTQVELQFVEYNEAIRNIDTTNFVISDSNTEVIVPAVSATMIETSGSSHEFMVKSLPFAIGTWALRISGLALDQKRDVRDSDIDHFMHLIDTPHDETEVLDSIKHHPQMPASYSAEDVMRAIRESLLARGRI